MKNKLILPLTCLIIVSSIDSDSEDEKTKIITKIKI